MSLCEKYESAEYDSTVSEERQLHQRVLGSLNCVDLEFVLDNDTSLISPLISYLQEQIEAVCSLEDFQLMELTRIGVAMHESLTNAIYHGNLELNSELRQEDESIFYRLAEERRKDPRFAQRQVHINARLSPTQARFVVRDDGPGFNASETTNPTDEINLDRIGGRGLLLIRSFMDEVNHNPQGNEITMVKLSCPRDSNPRQARNEQSASCFEQVC